MNRKKFLTAAVAGAIGITSIISIPAAMAAMGARIDSPLKVTTRGVAVTGTVTSWDSDAKSAVFTARIVQGSHVAKGTSTRYPAGATRFGLFATGSGLHPGAATGYGKALITNKDGSTETYTWSVPVTLTS
jgi:hypothetical protein